MNKIRRKNLQSIIDQLEELKGSLEDLQAEEEEYRDNIPENMQDSERYEKADDACDNLSDAVDSLEEAIACIEAAIEGRKKGGRPEGRPPFLAYHTHWVYFSAIQPAPLLSLPQRVPPLLYSSTMV